MAAFVTAAAARWRAMAEAAATTRCLRGWARRGSSRGGNGSSEACGGGDSGWTPSPAFREQPLEREETPFFSQMTARVFGWGGGSLPLL